MFRTIYKSIVVTGALVIILSGIYPLAIWVIGQAVFPHQANGSLLLRDGRPVGSSLIGQGFTKPEYFHGRPSSAGEKGYDAANSSGSNLGPTSKKLVKAVEGNINAVLAENPGLQKGSVPVDLVTSSGSGLDPHISPEAAEIQVARVATARKADAEKVRALVAKHTLGRQLGIFGEPVVNVLELNLELDSEVPLAAAK
jgi:potassium-transporting ATPase KdpC subunit